MKIASNVRSGFSLIEIMVAVVILGLIMAVLAPRFMGGGEAAKVDLAKIELKRLQEGVKQFKLATGKYPERLRDLIDRPQDEKVAKKWRRVWDGELPEDPFDNEYRYRLTPGGAHPYELYSEGPEDGEPISVWD